MEHSRHVLLRRFLSKEQVLNLAQWTILTIVDKVIPRARVAVQDCRSLDELRAVWAAALAFEGIVSVTTRVWPELEQLPKRVERKMPLHIFGCVNNAGRERLFVGLALENLLLDGASGYESIYETILLLPISPYPGQGLLVSGRVPIRVE